MLKKIALLLLIVLPLGVFAQTLKFGHVNSFAIIEVMPEYSKATSDMQVLQQKYQEEIKRAEDEFGRKYQELLQMQDSLPRNILERRQKELQDLQERGMQFQQEVQENLTKAQQDMMNPIVQKVQEAIVSVGQEGNYIYIFDLARTPIPFVNDKQSIDVSTAVKTKLGIK